MIRRIKIHPAQVAELLVRSNAKDAAEARLSDAASIIAMGAGIVEGQLQGIDTDTNELVIDVHEEAQAELHLEAGR
jgi:hypothetical protein